MNKPYTPRPGSNAEKAVNILRQHNRAMRTPEIVELTGSGQVYRPESSDQRERG